MKATKERFFIYIGKLEATLKEFMEASIPELEEMNHTDTDEYKREYLRFKSAVLGQLDNIAKKANEVMEDKIVNASFSTSEEAELRNQCYNKKAEFDDLLYQYSEEIEATHQEDYEIKYQNILDEYEAIKDKFVCTQCGSPITIEKIYFTTTYINCSACSTRNTFEPSSQSKMLENLGRDLAEQRTAHLLKEYNEIDDKLDELHEQGHELNLSLIHEKDKNIIKQKENQIQELEKQYEELENKGPGLYQKYLRAMFDEWNKINPDMQQEHEKFYNRLSNEN